MPKTLTQYRVFIGSPGGLEEERRLFRDRLKRYSETHAKPQGVIFDPIGWEETIGGVGRPQALINADLEERDYAVFVLHDRWGSPTGDTYTSGVDEEWTLAERLYETKQIRNIVLCFKAINPHQLRDPGQQLTRVLAFKAKIEREKRYLFRAYDGADAFSDYIDYNLAKWF